MANRGPVRQSAQWAGRAMLFVALAAPAAPAAPSAFATPPADRAPSLADRLPREIDDPLAPFQLSLNGSLDDLRGVADTRILGTLKAKQDTYLRVGLPLNAPALATGLPAPDGTSVIDGDFYFRDGKRLMEATLLLSSEVTPERAILGLSRFLGRPEFEVVIPGAFDIVAGWRTSQGFLIATFDDLPIFKLTAFRNTPDDVVAGSQVLLYEGLCDYSTRLAAGESSTVLLHDLVGIVNEASVARNLVQPVR